MINIPICRVEQELMQTYKTKAEMAGFYRGFKSYLVDPGEGYFSAR